MIFYQRIMKWNENQNEKIIKSIYRWLFSFRFFFFLRAKYVHFKKELNLFSTYSIFHLQWNGKWKNFMKTNFSKCMCEASWSWFHLKHNVTEMDIIYEISWVKLFIENISRKCFRVRTIYFVKKNSIRFGEQWKCFQFQNFWSRFSSNKTFSKCMSPVHKFHLFIHYTYLFLGVLFQS